MNSSKQRPTQQPPLLPPFCTEITSFPLLGFEKADYKEVCNQYLAMKQKWEEVCNRTVSGSEGEREVRDAPALDLSFPNTELKKATGHPKVTRQAYTSFP